MRPDYALVAMGIAGALVMPSCGGSNGNPGPTPPSLTLSPMPDPTISLLTGPDDAHHFHFDKVTFGIGCESTLLASKEDRPAARQHDIDSAAAEFMKLADLSGQYLALIVRVGDQASFQRVLEICASNGADVAGAG